MRPSSIECFQWIEVVQFSTPITRAERVLFLGAVLEDLDGVGDEVS